MYRRGKGAEKETGLARVARRWKKRRSCVFQRKRKSRSRSRDRKRRERSRSRRSASRQKRSEERPALKAGAFAGPQHRTISVSVSQDGAVAVDDDEGTTAVI